MVLRHADYTVGWISSIPIELTAAVSMLDERHPELPLTVGDSNNYILGRVAGYNVVITCSSHRTYGRSSSAVVATNLIRSFPAVRFGLLVGIGGGVPSSSNDIRLGDVVVSTPEGHYGAVAQYDLRKATPGIRPIRWLNRPPPNLLEAVNLVEIKMRVTDNDLTRHIKEAILHYPELKEHFTFPGREQDLLFKSDYDHEGDQCTNCSASNLIERAPRNSTDPIIHHGSIASGDLIVKDAATRDRLSRELDVICFETEAAGLMKDFPCIMIRGIANYSDSHSNTSFQKYAAMTAAAYAKELLACSDAASVQQFITAAELLDLDISTSTGIEKLLEVSYLSTEGSSTMIGGLEPELVDTTIGELAWILASDRRLKPLYNAAVLRMESQVFQRNVTAALGNLGKGMKKAAQTPLERATAWMLRRYKQAITMRIYKLVQLQLQDSPTMAPRLSYVDFPYNQRYQLMRFVDERFPEPQSTFNRSELSQAEDADLRPSDTENVVDEQLQEVDPEEDEPDPAALDDLSQVNRILCGGDTFDELFKLLKKSLFPTPIELINKVLRRHVFHDSQPKSITCVIDWQLLEYCDNENLTADDLHSVFTLTGEFDRSCALSLGNYMEGKWKTGKSLLDGIKRSLARYLRKDANEPETEVIADDESQIEMRLLPKSADAKEQAFVTISGSFDRIAETLEQFAWLTATLRLYLEDQLTVSDIDFRARQTKIGDTIKPVFHISLYSQDEVCQPNSDAPGQCWTSLFTGSVLAHGFSLYDTDRPEGVLGLELPFEIMLWFAGVKYPVWFEQRLAFASESSVLIPQRTFGDSIQWHFQKIGDLINHDINAKVPDPQLEDLDMQKLTESRAFLGYFNSSEVLLGTADFADIEISRSQVPRTGRSIEFKLDGSVTMGFIKYVTGNIGIVWRFNRRESYILEAKDLDVNGRLDRAARASTLLYDDEACIAYLVSELSVILQMVSIHVRKHSRLKSSEIPQADRSADGGAAARRAIEEAQNLEVPLAIGSQKYIDIVDSFLNIIEQRKIQSLLNRKQYGRISLRRGLRGWDFADIQLKNFESLERQLSPAPAHSRPIWWKLFKTPECLVLFARITKSPLRSCDPDAGRFHCCAWEEIPNGRHVLLANMNQLLQLKDKLCQTAGEYSDRYMLTNKIAWSRPRYSRLFEESCREGGSCNPVQAMCKVGTMREKWRSLETRYSNRGEEFLPNPGNLEPAGTALFVDDPASFEARACWQHRRPLA